MKLILIIDDDGDLRASLKQGLEKNNFAVVAAESADEAVLLLEKIQPDAMVVDRMMPGTDGLSFLKKIRMAGDKTPAVMLTALDGAENAIAGLEGGADDYLAKPFALRELVLRLEKLLRHSVPFKMPDGLNLAGGEFFINGKLLALSETEKAALEKMLSGAPAPMAAMTAKRLREKLIANLKNCDIIAVRNKGYKLLATLKP